MFSDISDPFGASVFLFERCAPSENYLSPKQSPPISHSDQNKHGGQLLLSNYFLIPHGCISKPSVSVYKCLLIFFPSSVDEPRKKLWRPVWLYQGRSPHLLGKLQSKNLTLSFLHMDVKYCSRLKLSNFLKEVQISITIFHFSVKNALNCVQTSLYCQVLQQVEIVQLLKRSSNFHHHISFQCEKCIELCSNKPVIDPLEIVLWI